MTKLIKLPEAAVEFCNEDDERVAEVIASLISKELHKSEYLDRFRKIVSKAEKNVMKNLPAEITQLLKAEGKKDLI